VKPKNRKNMEEKILTNNNLQQMGNPMQNLLSVMESMICHLGVAENADALNEIKKASKSITKALDIVNKNVYSV
jgi:flagellin-specific chaperone FliS